MSTKVCGSDGRTYDSECHAECAGISVSQMFFDKYVIFTVNLYVHIYYTSSYVLVHIAIDSPSSVGKLSSTCKNPN